MAEGFPFVRGNGQGVERDWRQKVGYNGPWPGFGLPASEPARDKLRGMEADVVPIAEDADREEPDRGSRAVATRRIAKGEVVVIKGGHVLDLETLARTRARTAVSYIQVEDGCYIGARTRCDVARARS